MRRIITTGRARFELRRGLLDEGPPRGGGKALSFTEDTARSFVRTLAREPGVSALLRAFLHHEGASQLAQREDADALSELARRFHAGWIRVYREELPPLTADNGEEELEAPVRAERFEERAWKAAVHHEPPPRWKATTQHRGPPIWKVTTTLRKPVYTPLDEPSEREPR